MKEKETLATASGDVNPQPFESDLNPVVFAPIRPMTPVKDGSSHGMSSGRRSSVLSTPQPLTPTAKFLNMSSGSSDRLSDRRCLTPQRSNKTTHTPKNATNSQANHELEGLKALLHGYGLPTNAKDLERHLSCHDLITNIDKTPSHAVDQSQHDTDLPGASASRATLGTSASRATIASARSVSTIHAQRSNTQKATFHRHMGNLLDRPGHQATILRRWRTSLRGDMQTMQSVLADEKRSWMKALYQAFVRMLKFGGTSEPNDVQLREICYEMRKTYVDKLKKN